MTICRSPRSSRLLARGARDLHVVVTGRNAKPELIEAADCVTEFALVKHHFAAGVRAQEGDRVLREAPQRTCPHHRAGARVPLPIPLRSMGAGWVRRYRSHANAGERDRAKPRWWGALGDRLAP